LKTKNTDRRNTKPPVREDDVNSRNCANSLRGENNKRKGVEEWQEHETSS